MTTAGRFRLEIEAGGFPFYPSIPFPQHLATARSLSRVFTVFPGALDAILILRNNSDARLSPGTNRTLPLYIQPVVQPVDQYGNGVAATTVTVAHSVVRGAVDDLAALYGVCLGLVDISGTIRGGASRASGGGLTQALVAFTDLSIETSALSGTRFRLTSLSSLSSLQKPMSLKYEPSM